VAYIKDEVATATATETKRVARFVIEKENDIFVITSTVNNKNVTVANIIEETKNKTTKRIKISLFKRWCITIILFTIVTILFTAFLSQSLPF